MGHDPKANRQSKQGSMPRCNVAGEGLRQSSPSEGPRTLLCLVLRPQGRGWALRGFQSFPPHPCSLSLSIPRSQSLLHTPLLPAVAEFLDPRVRLRDQRLEGRSFEQSLPPLRHECADAILHTCNSCAYRWATDIFVCMCAYIIACCR